MIMKASAYTFSKGDRADQIQRLSEDLELLVRQAIFGAHMSCQLIAWLTTACHVVEATRRDIELGGADRTRKGRVLSYPLQDLIAPPLIPERRTNIPGRRSQPVSSVELDGLLCRAGPLGARRRTVVARFRNLAQNLLLRRKPLGPARHKLDPGNLAAANENITQRYCVLSVMGSPFPILIQFFSVLMLDQSHSTSILPAPSARALPGRLQGPHATPSRAAEAIVFTPKLYSGPSA